MPVSFLWHVFCVDLSKISEFVWRNQAHGLCKQIKDKKNPQLLIVHMYPYSWGNETEHGLHLGASWIKMESAIISQTARCNQCWAWRRNIWSTGFERPEVLFVLLRDAKGDVNLKNDFQKRDVRQSCVWKSPTRHYLDLKVTDLLQLFIRLVNVNFVLRRKLRRKKCLLMLWQMFPLCWTISQKLFVRILLHTDLFLL